MHLHRRRRASALVTVALAAALLIGSTLTAPAASAKTTRIVFKRGSYCATYSGDFRRPRQFLLGLQSGQVFVVKNVGSGSQYDISVSGPSGPLDGTRESATTLVFDTELTGDHFVTVSSLRRYNSVRFCAYDSDEYFGE